MSQRLQELCALLVQDACGHLCSQIFTHLAENGRITRQRLQHLMRIPSSQLKHALAVLVQNHLVLHYTTYDDTSFYQVDWRNAYSLIRSNRIISLVEDRYGSSAGKIIATLLQLGHAQVGDLAQAFDLSLAPTPHNGSESSKEHVNGETEANGTNLSRSHESKIVSIGQFHHTLRALLRAGFVVKMGKRVYMPAADLQAEIEEAVIGDKFPDGKVTGPKKQAEFKSAVNDLKRKWRDANEYSEQLDTESREIIRRPGMQPNKRAKLNGGGLTNGIEHDDVHLDDDVPNLPNDMVLKVNYAQCSVAFRTQRLEQMAEPYLGGVTAHVYGVLLQVLEEKLRARDDNVRVDDENSDEEDEENHLPVTTTMDVAKILDPSLDLTLGVQGAAEKQMLLNGDHKSKKKIKGNEFADIGIGIGINEDGIKEEAISDSDDHLPVNGYTSYRDQNKQLTLVEEHLKLLAEHSKGFCRRVGGGGRGEWRVNFPALTDALIQAEIDSTISSRFGKIHTRIVRLLRERGRLEEKQVAAFAMMRMKDVRSVLTELQYASFVDVQEIPKDASRQPARTTYLWFHEQSRVQSLLLQHTYQGISRTFQRLGQERVKYRSAIDKAEMMDVKQEDLKQNERDDVMQWREIEEKLLAQVQRMDDMVALLRDMSGDDNSLVS